MHLLGYLVWTRCKLRAGSMVHYKRLYWAIMVGLCFVLAPKPNVVHGQATVSYQLGLQGYCPVAIHREDGDGKPTVNGKWVQGDQRYAVLYDGVIYFCEDAQKRDTFLENPGKYVPAYNGWCTVCKIEEKLDVLGDVNHTCRYKGRLFLFPGENSKRLFLNNPEHYIKVCTHPSSKCLVAQKQGSDDNGKPEFAASFRAKLYLFSSSKNLNLFHKDPYKYVPASPRKDD